MKIALGMIVRNEEKTLERCLESVRPYVDKIVIGLAGKSTDNTPKIARKYADKLIIVKWEDHFAAARNGVMQYCEDADYYMWLDGDDELINGDRLRRYIEGHPNVSQFSMPYDYGRDENEQSVSFLVRERVVRNGEGWHWEGRIHEYLTTDQPHETFVIPDVVVKHHGAGKKRGLRNLQLLYRDLEEVEPNPSDRLLFYLGREEALRGNDDVAVMHLQRFIAQSSWDEEAYMAAHSIADIRRRSGRLDEAEKADLLAIRMNPHWADAYFGLAETAFHRGEWEAAIEWTKTANEKDIPRTSLVINPRDYDFNPLIVLAGAYLHSGDIESAILNYRLAHQISPNRELENQIMGLREHARLEKALANFMGLAEFLGRNDEWLKIRKLFAVAPKQLESHPEVVKVWQQVLENTAHIDHPEIMIASYQDNPGWIAMPLEQMKSDAWQNHPRVKWAQKVVKSAGARTVVDLGAADGIISIPLWMNYPDVKVDALDIDPHCIIAGQEKVKELGTDNVKFYEGGFHTAKEWSECENFVKYDMALFFETIEHVVDVEATLDMVEAVADRVAITTPFLAWERGETEDWNAPGFKAHLRIFDLNDIESLLTRRGQIHNLYFEPYGRTGWIFADYSPGPRLKTPKVSIVCPPALEDWGPVKLQQEGLGGSETAVIKLAEQLAASDLNVTVYNTPDRPGYFEGVRYRDVDGFIPDVYSDLLIAWRSAEIADVAPRTGRLVLWMHDVLSSGLTPERASRFDFIVVLSEWHRSYVIEKCPWIDRTKLLIIGNGVDLERFMGEMPDRNPKRVVYASSPDRGLDIIIKAIWPRVLREVPDAELHYYYGWNNFNNSKALAMNPELKEFKQDIANATIDVGQIFNHGRITQEKLAQEMMRGSLWLYPTYFLETYCITAIEAQLAGLVPIYNPIGALSETVQSGIAIEGNPRDEKVIDSYVEAVIVALNTDFTDAYRFEIADGAPAKSWWTISREWIKLIPAQENVLAEVT